MKSSSSGSLQDDNCVLSGTKNQGRRLRAKPSAETQLCSYPSFRGKNFSLGLVGFFLKQIACNKLMLSVNFGCTFCFFQGKTGHAEVVRVVYQPERISFEELLKVFWENHDPTQGR